MERTKAPAAILLGIVCLCGAATIAWYSSPAIMRLTRNGPDAVAVAFESRLFNLFLIDEQRIDEARSISTSTDTVGRLIFHTSNGPVDVGRVQQLFVPYYGDVKRFFAAKTIEPELDGERRVEPPNATAISSIASGSETRRFVVAQSMVLLLTLVGGGVIWITCRALFGRDTTIGPR